MGTGVRQTDGGGTGEQPIGCIVRIRVAHDPGDAENEDAVQLGPICDTGDGAGADQRESGGEDEEPGGQRLTWGSLG